MSEERHPIFIETWCKTNGCRADVYRQEIRRLKDEKLALEARLSKMEEERDEWHAAADRHLKEKNALIVAEALQERVDE